MAKIEIKITDDQGNEQQYVVSGWIPKDEDIEKVANAYKGTMNSMAEATWMPEGFKDGAKWMRKKLTGM